MVYLVAFFITICSERPMNKNTNEIANMNTPRGSTGMRGGLPEPPRTTHGDQKFGKPFSHIAEKSLSVP
jgi:hypothetical protein